MYTLLLTGAAVINLGGTDNYEQSYENENGSPHRSPVKARSRLRGRGKGERRGKIKKEERFKEIEEEEVSRSSSLASIRSRSGSRLVGCRHGRMVTL